MKFIYTAAGQYVALSEVVRATPQKAAYLLDLQGGEAAKVGQQEFDEALRLDIVGVVPAERGYAVVELVTTETGTQGVHQEPVLAWAVNTSGETLPVCATGVRAGLADVLVPDGRVVMHDGWQENLEDWKVAMATSGG